MINHLTYDNVQWWHFFAIRHLQKIHTSNKNGKFILLNLHYRYPKQIWIKKSRNNFFVRGVMRGKTINMNSLLHCKIQLKRSCVTVAYFGHK